MRAEAAAAEAWMLRVMQWLMHGSREAEQPEDARTTSGQTERKENSEDAV